MDKSVARQRIINWLNECESKIGAGCFCMLRDIYRHHPPCFWCGSTGKLVRLQQQKLPDPCLVFVWHGACAPISQKMICTALNYHPCSLDHFGKDLSSPKVGIGMPQLFLEGHKTAHYVVRHEVKGQVTVTMKL